MRRKISLCLAHIGVHHFSAVETTEILVRIDCKVTVRWLGSRGKQLRHFTGNEDGPSIRVNHVQPISQIQCMEDGRIVHVTECCEVVNTILNLHSATCMQPRRSHRVAT